jgi:transposase
MATGQLAKTDALDARALAHCAEAVRPVPRPVSEAQAQELSALLGRHRQLIALLTAAKNRLSAAPAGLHPRIQAHIRWLEQDRRDIDTAVGRRIRTSAVT